ncbi:hypothetical protein KGY73_10895 [bacterium]|nr:hypothetical protein [bacterium]
MSVTIDFTEEQFKALLKLVYLGNYMINGIRTQPNRLKEFDNLVERIYSVAQKAGCSDYIEYDKEDKTYQPAAQLEEEADDFIDDYDDNVFWEELILRLSQRDLRQEYGTEAVENMELRERLQKQTELEKVYLKEFEDNGIENITIQKKE